MGIISRIVHAFFYALPISINILYTNYILLHQVLTTKIYEDDIFIFVYYFTFIFLNFLFNLNISIAHVWENFT